MRKGKKDNASTEQSSIEERPRPSVPPKKPPAPKPRDLSKAVIPRPTAPPPGSTEKPGPKGPTPITTPNLWGPDSELAKHQNVVTEDLIDPELKDEDPKKYRKRIAVYILCVVAVIAVVAIITVVGTNMMMGSM
ncbi:MAG: hypothetical protein ACOYIK_11335 [Coriobacteriales bacterium]